MELSQIKSIKSPNLTIPGLHDIELYPFQKVGVMAIWECQRLILGDQVGLGKSVQTIASIQLLHNQDKLTVNDCLLVASAKEQWQEFFKAYTTLSTTIAETSDHSGNYLKRRFNVLIMNFSTMRTHVELLEKYSFKKIVVDEGLFKNPDGKTFQALSTLTRKAPRLLILNANPLENNLDEAYSHIELCKPGLMTKGQFMDRYCKLETKYFRTKYGTRKEETKIVGIKSIEALKELKKLMSEFHLARTSDDEGINIQLPKKVIKVIYVDLKAVQKKAYLQELKNFKEHKIKASVLLINLLKICQGKKEEWKSVENPEDYSAKAEALKGLVNSLEKQQFVFYSTYLDPLFACAKIIKNMGKKLGFYTGVQKETERNKQFQEFKQGERDALFITNAGQRSLNIENCQNLIEFNQLYNPEARNQLEGRIRRISSKYENIFIYKLIAKNTVEEKILELQDNKEELAKYVNADGEVPDNLTEEQISKLLGTRKSLINKDSLEQTKEVFESELA